MNNVILNNGAALNVVDVTLSEVKADNDAKRQFFETLAWEVDVLFGINDLSDDIKTFLSMSPKHILNRFIPNQLNILDKLRSNLRGCSNKIKELDEDIRALSSVTLISIDDEGFKSEYIYKTKIAAKSFIENENEVTNLREELGSYVIDFEFQNNRYNRLAEEIYGSLAVVFGVVKIKNLIRYGIKCYGGKSSKVDLYRWVNLDDVRNYEKPRWHYSIDFANKSLYIRRFDGKVVFCGSFDEFVNELI